MLNVTTTMNKKKSPEHWCPSKEKLVPLLEAC